MTESSVDDELRALQAQLVQVRARIADFAWGPDRRQTGTRPEGSYLGSVFVVVVLGGPTLLLGILAVLAVLTGDYAVAGFFPFLGALLVGPLVWAVRRAVRAVRPDTARPQPAARARALDRAADRSAVRAARQRPLAPRGG